MAPLQPTKDCYLVLGIDRNVDKVVIKAAFKAKALIHHPDKNPGDPDAQRRFVEAKMACEILSDPTQRGDHDQLFPPAYSTTKSSVRAGNPLSTSVPMATDPRGGAYGFDDPKPQHKQTARPQRKRTSASYSFDGPGEEYYSSCAESTTFTTDFPSRSSLYFHPSNHPTEDAGNTTRAGSTPYHYSNGTSKGTSTPKASSPNNDDVPDSFYTTPKENASPKAASPPPPKIPGEFFTTPQKSESHESSYFSSSKGTSTHKASHGKPASTRIPSKSADTESYYFTGDPTTNATRFRHYGFESKSADDKYQSYFDYPSPVKTSSGEFPEQSSPSNQKSSAQPRGTRRPSTSSNARSTPYPYFEYISEPQAGRQSTFSSTTSRTTALRMPGSFYTSDRGSEQYHCGQRYFTNSNPGSPFFNPYLGTRRIPCANSSFQTRSFVARATKFPTEVDDDPFSPCWGEDRARAEAMKEASFWTAVNQAEEEMLGFDKLFVDDF